MIFQRRVLVIYLNYPHSHLCYKPDEKIPHNRLLHWLGKGLYKFSPCFLLHKIRYNLPKDSTLHLQDSPILI